MQLIIDSVTIYATHQMSSVEVIKKKKKVSCPLQCTFYRAVTLRSSEIYPAPRECLVLDSPQMQAAVSYCLSRERTIEIFPLRSGGIQNKHGFV